MSREDFYDAMLRGDVVQPMTDNKDDFALLASVERCKEGLANLRDWFWNAAEFDAPEWCRAQSDLCDEAAAALDAFTTESALQRTTPERKQ